MEFCEKFLEHQMFENMFVIIMLHPGSQKEMLSEKHTRLIMVLSDEEFRRWYQERLNVLESELSSYCLLTGIPQVGKHFRDHYDRLKEASVYLRDLSAIRNGIAFYKENPDAKKREIPEEDRKLVDRIVEGQLQRETYRSLSAMTPVKETNEVMLTFSEIVGLPESRWNLGGSDVISQILEEK